MSDAGFGTIFVSVKIEEKQGLWESLCDYKVGFGFLGFFFFTQLVWDSDMGFLGFAVLCGVGLVVLWVAVW